MKKTIIILLLLALAGLNKLPFSLARSTCCFCQIDSTQAEATKQPYPFSEEIQNFEALDQANPPFLHAILFIGSSSIRLWQTLAEDMAPLPVINRGFGGSQAEHAVHYIDRIVLPYRPLAIVFYEGDNDMAAGVSPDKFVDHCREFAEIVHQKLPETIIYFLSIKPSYARFHVWGKMQAANLKLKEFARAADHLKYIDISAGMFDRHGKLKSDIFQPDSLHLNEKGYQIWTAIIKAELIADLKNKE